MATLDCYLFVQFTESRDFGSEKLFISEKKRETQTGFIPFSVKYKISFIQEFIVNSACSTIHIK